MQKMLGDARFRHKVMTMEQAIVNHESFDIFVIDEADKCVLEMGSVVNIEKKQVQGFWDLLTKRAILLTATVN